jgi:hypothetical protein
MVFDEDIGKGYQGPTLEDALKKVKKYMHQKPTDKRDYIFSELTKDEDARLRFHPNLAPEYGPRWGRGLGLYRTTLPLVARQTYEHVINLVKPEEFQSSSALVKAFKEVVNYYRVEANIPYWNYLEGLERCGGYQDTKGSEFDQDVREWVSEKPKPPWFMRRFKESLKTVISRMSQGRNVEYISPIDWVIKAEEWITSGSIDVKLGEYAGMKIPKTKTAAAFVLTKRQLYNLLEQWKSGYNKAVPKRELSKVRAIIAGDFSTYLKMAYISHWIEEDMRGSELSTLTMNTEQTLQMWYKLSKSLPELRFPLDQGSFDQNISAEMIIETIKALRDFYVVREPTLGIWFKKVLYAVRHGQIELDNGSVIPWEGGVLSGWRWTALLDTIINLAQVESARDEYIDRYGVDPLEQVIAQGDDDQMTIRSYSFIDFILKYYEQAGFEVNPNKMYIATERDDFLRKTILKDSVSGPPARAVNALIWADPSKRIFDRGMDRIESTVNNWMTLIGRGNNTQAAWDLMLLDIHNFTNIPIGALKKLLKTPKTLGGLGVLDPGNSNDFLSLTVTTERKVFKKIKAPPYLNEYWRKDIYFYIDEMGDWGIPIFDYRNELEKVVDTIIDYEPLKEKIYVQMALSDPLPLTPRWKTEVPTFALDKVIVEKWKEDEDSVRDLIEDLSVYNIVLKKARRSVFLDWLSGKLEYKPPIVVGVGQELVSVVFQKLAQAAWGRLLRRGNVNRFDLRKSYTFVEIMTRLMVNDIVEQYTWRITP